MSKLPRELAYGETPWDALSQDELLREVQRMYCALLSLQSVALSVRNSEPSSPFWAGGIGGAALEKARQILAPLHEEFEPENIYRSFFRYAEDLLFERTGRFIGFGWTVCPTCGIMLGERVDGTSFAGVPCSEAWPASDHNTPMRPIQWVDLQPKEPRERSFLRGGLHIRAGEWP